jgi:DNA repair protein RecO (recombination protein O)
MLNKDCAICIQASDYSETSQVLTFFGRQSGKIRCIAKGSKRPKSSYDGAIERFAYGDIVFSSSGEDKLSTLTEFEQQKPFTALAANLSALNSALFAAELISKFTKDNDPHPQLFESFLQFLKDSNDSPRTGSLWLSLLILFQLSLLSEVGLQPVINRCVNCKTGYREPVAGKEVFFSSSANGLVCGDCESAFTDKVRLSAAAAKCLTNLKLISNADKDALKEIEKILIYHFTEILGKPPKMAKYILKT